jgi:hypothetical protein
MAFSETHAGAPTVFFNELHAGRLNWENLNTPREFDLSFDSSGRI